MRRALAVFLIVACILAVCYGGFALYQHRLSSDVRPLLAAACADNISVNEIKSYLHDARPLLRTTKDPVTFQKLEHAITLLSSSQEYHDGFLDRMKAHMEDLQVGNENGECSGRWWRIVNKKLPGVQEAYNEMKECQKRRQEADDRDAKIAEADSQEGVRLYNEVRNTLGLPPLKQGLDTER